MHHRRPEAVGIGIDIAWFGIDLRDAIFAGNAMEANHRDETVLASEGNALVKQLQPLLVYNLAILGLAILHPAAVVKRQPDEVEAPVLDPLEMIFPEARFWTRPAHSLKVEPMRREWRSPIRRIASVILIFLHLAGNGLPPENLPCIPSAEFIGAFRRKMDSIRSRS